jgi:NAD(P)-dependent dehydrogenase (short-subunit alcohol dehydrogenase family)
VPSDVFGRVDSNNSRTFRTNIISQFHLTSLFVPPLLEHPTGGTIVTVSSVLSRLGASQLSAYTASKAGLVAYHASLAAELAIHPKIKTILATPGQLTTDMFNGLEQGPIARFFAPIVEVQDLAMRIVKMIDSGNGGVISVPTYARWISCMDILPVGLQKMLRDLAGVDTAMSKFQPKATEQEQENSIVFVEKAGEALSTSA